MTPHRPRTSRGHEGGFTLLELMVVVLIMGTVLLLVPPNLSNFGSRGKLNSSANSLVSAVNGARERAILDSYEVSLEIGSFKDGEGDWQQGWRFQFTNIPAPKEGDPNDPSQQEDLRQARTQEREWLYSTWHPLPDGIKIVGVSDRKGQWAKLSDGGKPYQVRFYADGNIEKGIAVRLESEDMEDARREYRTVTVLVNPLTSEPAWREGLHELKEARPASDFGN